MYISISKEFKSVATINLPPVSIIIITFLCTCIHTLCMQLESAESASNLAQCWPVTNLIFVIKVDSHNQCLRLVLVTNKGSSRNVSTFFCAGELSRAGATSPRIRNPEVFLTVTAAPKCY